MDGDGLTTPAREPQALRPPPAPKRVRRAPRRHEDACWRWPRTLCFLTGTEIESIPKDVRDKILQHLEQHYQQLRSWITDV